MKNNNRKLVWQLPFLTFLVIGSILIVRQQHNMPFQHDNGFIFGTVYDIKYQCDSNLQQSVKAELDKVDKAMSMFNKESTVSKINRGERPDISGTMFEELYNTASLISKDTQGAFDITVSPLVNAWGFGFKNAMMPTKGQVDSMLQFVGYEKISLIKEHNGTFVDKKDSRVTLDLSSIAKGYGCDIVARLLRERGVRNFMINIGGEIVASGTNENAKPWQIGVNKPTDDSLNTNGDIQTILSIRDKAMATSGNYRNFYYKDGKKYAHTIDPHSGYPVQHNILSSTVIADNCATADAYATAFMVLGLEGAKAVLNRRPELMAYFIYADKDGKNAIWYSPSMKSLINK
ncbi:MAG: FAD:protein FMN transferase [Prevotella sp.]|nr:FAD:protein FMN transferase [Prevotella sp.]